MLAIENGSYRPLKVGDDVFYSKEQLEAPMSKNRPVSKTFDLGPMEIAVVEEFCVRHGALERYFCTIPPNLAALSRACGKACGSACVGSSDLLVEVIPTLRRAER